MFNDILSIVVYAAEQLIEPTNEMVVVFVLTPFGPVVQIETRR